MRALTIIFILIFAINSKGLSQDNLKPKIWLGIWDYKLKYQGAFQTDSILFDPKWNNLYHLKVKAIQEMINSEIVWYYVLVAKDSLEILKTDFLMQQINITDYENTWRFDYNGPMSYLKDTENPARLEFLPNGHWLYFSTEKSKVGVSLEKFVKNHQLDKFSKFYDLETGLEYGYFEIENGLLNGIEYFDVGAKNRIKAIRRYKNGMFIESLYNRND